MYTLASKFGANVYISLQVYFSHHIYASTSAGNQKFNIPISIDISIKTHQFVCVVAKVNWRIKYTLAPNFEANVYISPKL